MSISRQARLLIEEWEGDGFGSGEIYRKLQSSAALRSNEKPSPRTVRRIVNQELRGNASEPWTLVGSKLSPAGNQFVVETLGAVLHRTAGRRSGLTVLEAGWVARVRQLAPQLSPWDAYRVASLYAMRKDRDEPTDDLDALLAYSPWRSSEHAYKYRLDQILGRVPAPPDRLRDLEPDAVDHGSGASDDGGQWVQEWEKDDAGLFKQIAESDIAYQELLPLLIDEARERILQQPEHQYSRGMLMEIQVQVFVLATQLTLIADQDA